MTDRRSDRRADYARNFPALARRRQRGAPPRDSFSQVTIGQDADGRPVYIDDRTRTTHAHIIGTTGAAKTSLLKHVILQDIRRGLGGIVIDPHGLHSDSLYATLVTELARDGFFDTNRIILLDPNCGDYIVPINFLARRDGIAISVLADALVEAVSAVWGGEDLHTKPTLRSTLKAIFQVLTELGLPLSDAPLLLRPHDEDGVRARSIERLADGFARDKLETLHQIANDDRSKRDFRAEVVGPLNRLADFNSSLAVSTMLGLVDLPGKRQTLDLLECMDRGYIILVNAQHGEAISEADAALIGALLIRYIFLLAGRRAHNQPFFVTIDECHRFINGSADLPGLLAESRKAGIGIHLAHQFLRQLGERDSLLYQACMTCPGTRLALRLTSPPEAQELAEFVTPLSLEVPVAASIRPTVVGHRRVRLGSQSTTFGESSSQGEVDSEATMVARTNMHSLTEAVGDMTISMTGDASAEGSSESSGVVMNPPLQFFGPNAPNATAIQFPVAESNGKSNSLATSKQAAQGQGTSHMSAETLGRADTQARSRSTSRSSSRSQSSGRTAGESEAFEPVYEMLPSAWHSKENELYRAGEMLRGLKTGEAVMATAGRSVKITIPKPKELPAIDVRALVVQLQAKSPFAIPRAEALRQIAERQARLRARPSSSDPIIVPEPMPIVDDPIGFAAGIQAKRKASPKRKPTAATPGRPAKGSTGKPHNLRIIDGVAPGDTGEKP